MNILVTGGAGFIGSHTLIELYKAGHTAVVVDNLSNSNSEALHRVAEIIGVPKIPFYKVDIRDRGGLEKVLADHKCDACIHFAGLKAVGESVEKPWEYYENNIGGTLTLVDVMRKNDCKNIIYSSSATIYGDPAEIPITEKCPKGQCTNPYGWTKSMLEQVLMDIQKADPEWNVVLLRYFNPVGAHPSGRIGENPNGIPNNLMPYITQVAVGKRKELGVFGNDYDTPDGTGVRDFIHVCDLANAHIAALHCFSQAFKHSSNQAYVYNVGTGHGYSVLDMVKAFIKVNGVDIHYSIKPRRAGDIATCYCNPSKAKAELGWEAKYGIEEMVRDSWNWQRKNPEGYPQRITTAVIMAAGLGTRFGEQTELKPKGFIPFKGKPMVIRAIETMFDAGIEKVIIGTGYHKEFFEAFEKEYPGKVQCVFSPRFAETNSMYTLWNCREAIGEDDFLLFESDLVFEKRAVTELIECPYDSAMLITPVTKFQDQYYVQMNDKCELINCSVNKEEITPSGELVGIHKMGNKFYKVLCSEYEKIIEKKPKLGYEFQLLDVSQRIIPLNVLKLENLQWYEIDDEQDLKYAEDNIKIQ